MNRYQDVPKEALAERAKELECLYLIDEALIVAIASDDLRRISDLIPVGFRNVEACRVVIELDGQLFYTKPMIEDGDDLISNIVVNNEVRGYIKVSYPHNTFPNDNIIFLEHEKRLLNTIANKISDSIYKQNLLIDNKSKKDWETIITLLKQTDHDMLLYICEKMLALLACRNTNLVKDIFNEMNWTKYKTIGEINFPLETLPAVDTTCFCEMIFKAAESCLEDNQIYDYISLWIYQGKTYELIKKVDKEDSDVKSISKALKQYSKAVKDNKMTNEATKRWITVELIQRFLTDHLPLISNAQQYISIDSICDLLDNYICSPKRIGKIGGKGSGLFIAHQIIKAHIDENKEFEKIKIPRTWYISSCELEHLIEINGLEELNEHKYKDIIEIRSGYPRIIQMLKNSTFSQYISNELGKLLDSCDNKPLIVRSSSLLEDQVDSSFSGKYKSLFLTNTGSKEERLRKLEEAILEIYASMFNPDSIQYRKERKLIDCSEQMGIIIQEVVGTRVGPYFFPLYAGVAFSNNELRWSPRIKREDGLMRVVMGLGTRAVDRIGDDFPILVSPGQPNLRVNQTTYEMIKYSPRMMDIIDVENNKFLTLPVSQIIKEYSDQIPHISDTVSIIKNDFITDVNVYTTDFRNDKFIVTFDSLIRKSSIMKLTKSVLELLKEQLGYPVDIEFASDGDDFYLLQCRPQSRNYDNAPAPIPANIPFHDTIFTADKYISNGKVTGIKTVVYVDPSEYRDLEKEQDIFNIASAISEINRILPRKSFILMGPGRWGSRGDIKLGVPIAYSDINNTAMLIEMEGEKLHYQPELSFGTHFFQDLVEENIKYLPLYPSDKNNIFNRSFFHSCNNAIAQIVPSCAYLDHVIRVIQIEENYHSKELVVLMNADLEKAIAYLDDPDRVIKDKNGIRMNIEEELEDKYDPGWKWRHYMAEQIANRIDMDRYGIKGIYLFGSTNNCTAKLNSDIDLLIHFDGTQEQKEHLNDWLNGWSIALSEINFLKTGYKSSGLLDVHYVTDQDIIDKTSYAIKINSIYDPALPLRLR